MKNSFKLLLACFALAVIVLCLTASATPGYDEDGRDIDECQELGTCPEGYRCQNIPGSYICEGEGIEIPESNLVLDGTSSGLFYSVKANCTGLGTCRAICNRCYRTYSKPVIGKASSINGFCVCGSMSFKGF